MRAHCHGGIGLRGRLLGPARVSRMLVNVAGVASTSKAGSNFKYALCRSGKDDVDLFAELFGARRTRTRVRGSDVDYTFSVEFAEANKRSQETRCDGKALDRYQDPSRIEGQSNTPLARAESSGHWEGAEPGDALVEIHNTLSPIRRETTSLRRCPDTRRALAGANVRVATAP
jgi:hypothetical protein